MNRVLSCVILVFACGFAGNLAADVVIIEADRDSGFFDLAPDNNFGAHTHVPVGQANNFRVNHSVFHFAILENIPAFSTINSVTFEFEVTNQGGAQGQAGAQFDLHRVTRAWDEGTGTTDVGEVTMDGVTWMNATGAVLWTNDGGDFVPVISGNVFVNGPETYQMSGGQLIIDVQCTVDGLFAERGFLLKGNTNIPGSAARVTSREGGTPAKLIVNFTPPGGGVLVGDVNLDGVVSLLDVAPFVNRLSTGTYQAEADINEDGFVNLLDVNPFVALLSGG